MSIFEAVTHARTIRERLRRPPNAVPDQGIDLRRRPADLLRDVKPSSNSLKFVPQRIPVRVVIAWDETAKHIPIIFKPSTKNIGKQVAQLAGAYYGVSLLAMQNMYRGKDIVRPRHVAIYLTREIAKLSWHELGRVFNKDHSTCIHGHATIRDIIKVDADLAQEVALLEISIRNTVEGARNAVDA